VAGVSDGATNLHLELSLARELVLQKLEIEIIGGFDLGWSFRTKLFILFSL
jgi:hypothetical protein